MPDYGNHSWCRCCCIHRCSRGYPWHTQYRMWHHVQHPTSPQWYLSDSPLAPSGGWQHMELGDREGIFNLFQILVTPLATHNVLNYRFIPVIRLAEVTGSLLHEFVWPTTLMTYVSPQVSWSKVQLELVELQVVMTPLLSTADTTWVWSGPAFSQVTKALLVVHSRFTCTISGLHGPEEEEKNRYEEVMCVLYVCNCKLLGLKLF